jgi:TDG/mug DNA glycosylase family protein
MPVSFPPISRADARVLVLGTMPGAESLRVGQYYAHPRNAFWRIMATLFDFEPDLPYADRTRRLLAKQVAVWDVLQHCDREGSLDQNIENEVSNDFGPFFARHPSIHSVFFNGGNAERWCRKYAAAPATLKLKRLPSTSPTAARMNFSQKLRAWRTIRRALGEPEPATRCVASKYAPTTNPRSSTQLR